MSLVLGSIPSYPLAWPTAYPRTLIVQRRVCDSFTSFQQARWDVLGELMRLHARDIVLSSNLRVDAQGEPIYDHEPDDPGVAIWFRSDANTGVIACDLWQTVHLNLCALAATMMGIRGMYRFGTTHVLDNMLSGLRVEPVWEIGSPDGRSSNSPTVDAPEAGWWYVLGFDHPGQASLEEAEKRYRAKVKQAHPDRGGSDEAMRIFNEAIAQARNFYARLGEQP